MTITAAYYICLQYASEIFPTIVRFKHSFTQNIHYTVFAFILNQKIIG
jgi:hypothetical protein